MKKPLRYSHEKQDWNLNNADIFPDCDEEVVMCPLGYPGHKVYWLNKDLHKLDSLDGEMMYDVVVRIVHAHFVRNRDTGRHVDDVVGHIWVPESMTVVSRRLNYAKLPEWIKEENQI